MQLWIRCSADAAARPDLARETAAELARASDLVAQARVDPRLDINEHRTSKGAATSEIRIVKARAASTTDRALP